jgi:hypothetical protein
MVEASASASTGGRPTEAELAMHAHNANAAQLLFANQRFAYHLLGLHSKFLNSFVSVGLMRIETASQLTLLSLSVLFMNQLSNAR